MTHGTLEPTRRYDAADQPINANGLSGTLLSEVKCRMEGSVVEELMRNLTIELLEVYRLVLP